MQVDRKRRRYELSHRGAVIALCCGFACTVQGRVDDGACPDNTHLERGHCVTPMSPSGEQPVQQLLRPALIKPTEIRKGPGDRCRLDIPQIQDFGTVTVGRRAELMLVVKNHGTDVCRVDEVLFDTAADPAFVVRGAERFEIPAGETFAVLVAFSPTRAGLHRAHLRISTSTYRTSVALVGRAHELNGAILVDPPALSFGARRAYCQNAEWYAVQVRNPTEVAVTFDASITGSARSSYVVFDGEGRTLVPGGTTELLVGFSPDSFGDRWAQLALHVASGGQHFVALSGEGTDTAHIDEKFAGGQESLPLRATPEHGSIELLVDGNVIPARYGARPVWSVDFRARQIIFGPSHMPRESAVVEVRYEHPCLGTQCGDGILDPGEACDDGDLDETDQCLSTCRGAFCGDGFVRGGVEECDDQNHVLGDGCNDLCAIERCGNSYIEPPEECDQGPLNSNTRPDACRLNCRFSSCHDGILDDGESCDDANELNDDDCVNGCQLAYCGDGHIWRGVEECDDGNTNDRDECLSSCTFAAFHVTLGGAVQFGTPTGTPIVQTSSVPLPFTFNYLGRDVHYVDASVPGLVRFEAGASLPTINDTLPTLVGSGGFVAWWWDDELTTDAASSNWIAEEGAAPNRVVVLAFDEYRISGARVSAEVRLYEADGTIRVTYAEPIGRTGGGSGTVGWESIDGLRGEDVLGCAPECSLDDWMSGQEIQFTR